VPTVPIDIYEYIEFNSIFGIEIFPSLAVQLPINPEFKLKLLPYPFE